MKKILYLLLAAAMLLTVCACGNSAPAPVEPTDTPEITLPPVSYDKDEGRLTQEVSFNQNGLKYLTVFYDYDGHDRVTKEMSLGVNNAPEGYYTNEYDENGNIKLRVSYVALGPEEYEEEYRVNYEYDEAGNLVKETRVLGETVLAVTAYEYNEQGQCVSEKHYQGESFLAAEYSYGYDAKGRKANCVRVDNMEGETIENRYTYDANDRLITDLRCDAEGNVIDRIEYTYDEQGNELKRSVFGSDGVLRSFIKYEYTYDEAGNYTERVSTDSEGGSTTTTQYTWAYSKG